MKIQIFIIALFFICSCQAFNEKKTDQQIRKIQSDTNSASKVSFFENMLSDTLPSSLKILSLHKEYDSTSSSYNPEIDEIISLDDFKKWHLTIADVKDILVTSEEISGIEMDLSYAVLPFWYTGEILIRGKKGSFKINAASYTILMIDEKLVYLGCSSMNCNKYFLLPMNPE